MTQRETDILNRCVDKWGVESQFQLLLEEMAELQLAVLAITNRGGKDFDNLGEEIADVRLMVDQIERIFDLHDITEYYHGHKLDRLEAKLEDRKFTKRRFSDVKRQQVEYPSEGRLS